MKKSILRSFAAALCSAMLAFVEFAESVFLQESEVVAEKLTPKKLEVELAQNVAHKVTDNRKPVSIGCVSGDSPISFVSMLKSINSRSFCATA